MREAINEKWNQKQCIISTSNSPGSINLLSIMHRRSLVLFHAFITGFLRHLVIAPPSCLESCADVGAQQNDYAYPFGDEVENVERRSGGWREGLENIDRADTEYREAIDWNNDLRRKVNKILED